MSLHLKFVKSDASVFANSGEGLANCSVPDIPMDINKTCFLIGPYLGVNVRNCSPAVFLSISGFTLVFSIFESCVCKPDALTCTPTEVGEIMLHGNLKSVVALSLTDERHQAQRKQVEALCSWIESHLDEPIGWQELMEQSGLDYQTIQTLFYRHKCATAMTWIRLRRQAKTSSVSMRVQPRVLREAKTS